MNHNGYKAPSANLIDELIGHAGPAGSMQVICIETEAFYRLIQQVIAWADQQRNPAPDKWISDKEAMRMLRISSTTTLQKYRDQGMIRFSQPSRKIILYDRNSILEFIEANVRETF